MKTLITFMTLLCLAWQPVCSASIDFTPNHSVVLCGPTDVYFVCQSDQTVHNIWWDFGDGYSDVGINAVHRYTEPGVYDVKMVVEINGVKDSVTKQAFVTLHPMPDASFTVLREQFQIPFLRTFDYTGQTATDSIIAYRWKVDGQLISQQPKHKYAFPANGLYQVSLEVTNLSGCTQTKDSAIEIKDSAIPRTALLETHNQPYECILTNQNQQLLIRRSKSLAEALTIRVFDGTGKLHKQYTLAASGQELSIDLHSEIPTLMLVELSSQSFESVLKIHPSYL